MLLNPEMLGRAQTPNLPFEDPDGQPYRLDEDYFGNERNGENPYPGPFTTPENGAQLIKVWPTNTHMPGRK